MIPDLSIILLGTEEILERRLLERNVLTHFEKKMTRRDEIERYIKAAEFLKVKGFNVMTFYNDTESELSNSLNDVKEFITELERKKQNG